MSFVVFLIIFSSAFAYLFQLIMSSGNETDWANEADVNPYPTHLPVIAHVQHLSPIPVADLIRHERELFLQSTVYQFLKAQGWQDKIDDIMRKFDIVIDLVSTRSNLHAKHF
jgi:hypothetical protein